VRSTKIMVLQYKNHASNGAFGLAGGLIPPRLGWRAAEVKRAQLLMTARFREDGSGPDSLHLSIGEIEQLGGVTRGSELPGRAFENSVTGHTGGEGFSCMQGNTLIGIFHRAVQAWLGTHLPRNSSYAFPGRTILPRTSLQRGMSRALFSSYPQENCEKCHDNKGTNSCIQ